MYKLLANRLKILLAERDLSIKDVVNATGLTRPSISNMVNNPFANISTENVDKLCNYLEVTIGQFYDYLPWHLSIGYSLRDRKLKFRHGEKFKVGYFLVKASSGHKKTNTGFSIFLEAPTLNTNSPALIPGLIFSIQSPTNGSLDNLYNEMSPLFRHKLQGKILEVMKDFYIELNDEYNFAEIYQNSSSIKIYVDMYGTPKSYESSELFTGSFEYSFRTSNNDNKKS